MANVEWTAYVVLAHLLSADVKLTRRRSLCRRTQGPKPCN